MGTIEAQGNVLPRRGRVLTAATAGLLLLAACSGDDDKAPAQVISEQVSIVNDQCAEAVLADAATKFVVIENDGSTPEDELYDSTTKANTEAEPYIHAQMDTCMSDNLPGMTGYETKYPVFTPADPVKAPAVTADTTPVTSLES